jgi:hypothetical protein
MYQAHKSAEDGGCEAAQINASSDLVFVDCLFKAI